MVKIVEITYSLGQTIQVKDFHPRNFHASIKAEVSPKENLEKAYDKLKKIVGKQIQKDIQELSDKKTEAKNKIKFPFGQCSTCNEPLAKSKKGNLYCPNSFKNTPNNPHKQKTELSPQEKKFSESLDN